MTLQEYIAALNKEYKAGHATEHTYRPALQNYLASLLQGVDVSNEPKRISDVGAPDYVLKRKGIEVGYIEAKEINANLDKVEKGGKDDTQWSRYTGALPNIILTDYVEFRFFRDKQKIATVRIAEVTAKGLTPLTAEFSKLENLLKDFAAWQGQTIKSSKQLAAMMAAKAALMRDVFLKAVIAEDDDDTLKEQLAAFRKVLMHEMDAKQFADIYAQTIAYGLFTARLHDTSKDTFSRGEALLLIPKSNPFLAELFTYVAGAQLDSRVVWIVDSLCEVYRATNLDLLLKDFGAATGQRDPILHFYEDFLAAYDPALRDARGVWYTPEPVVRFIVRAVDDVLQTHFGLKDGLAHTGKVEIAVNGHDKGKTVKLKQQVHKVQLLDVATGTGTFLAEAIKQIHARYANQQGMWSGYVEQHLLPRLHGFELLMASYAMCHMKLDWLLGQLGYKPSNPEKPPRLGVYLTNSLEEYHADVDTLFAQWLAREANEASRIKRDMPIMVALGNPPYSGISSNMNSWVAKNKIEDYKYVDGVHFNERRHWLNDDYVQFIRLGEHYIEKNGEGVLAYITNHGYLDNPTFRGMRWHLLQTFDDIYIVDLHGNALKKEKAPDGSADENVFAIQQGVAIIVAVKTGAKKKKELAKVWHADLFGKREAKYDWLDVNSLSKKTFAALQPQDPFYFFVPKNREGVDDYEKGFAINDLMPVNATAIVTARDTLVIDFTTKELAKKIEAFADPHQSDSEIRNQFFGNKKEGKYAAGDSRGWKLPEARQTLKNHTIKDHIKNITYRPFDTRLIYYSPTMVDWPRTDVMRNCLKGDNTSLVIGRQGQVVGSMEWNLVYLSNCLSDFNLFYRGGGLTFPLYIYSDDMLNTKQPNFDAKIYAKIKKMVPSITPEGLFDYIYAVLHSPTYRTRYAEFLKSDFPRIPYPASAAMFDQLAALGGQIRALHLLESPVLDVPITSYPVDGTHEVVIPRFEALASASTGRVWLNETQYFAGVPKLAWEFYIGGYQPAQKWLKDRKGRRLTIDDLTHYQRMIVALAETHRLMQAIDAINFLPES